MEAEELSRFLRQSLGRRHRTMREFAEQEIVLPNGPYEGRKFSCDRQPFSGLLFDAIDSGRWQRFVILGPTQSGKTLSGAVIPLLYHLFEWQEDVVFGLPDLDMAKDKWALDIKPVIERSRYARHLPAKGPGSRGGAGTMIQFGNGAVLRFMGGGGGDKQRAGFTARVVIITETDGLDEPGAASRETDKIGQIEGRARAFGNRRRVYLECTVSTQEGRTWSEYERSTYARIMLPCPHCGEWVCPERPNLIGWDQAESMQQARESAAFACPACASLWTEAERTEANRGARLVLRGDPGWSPVEYQEKPFDPEAVPPRDDTFGFRWSAANNLFVDAGKIAADEWAAVNSGSPDLRDRELRQFEWALPFVPETIEVTALTFNQVCRRTAPIPKGQLPAGTKFLTVGMDIGKHLIHWCLIAWRDGAIGHIADYGKIDVAVDQYGTEKAILNALLEFKATRFETGWGVHGSGEVRRPDLVWIDSRYQQLAVFAAVRAANGGTDNHRTNVWWPARGFGAMQETRQRLYVQPEQRSTRVRAIGEEYHVVWMREHRQHAIHCNADHWKSWLHERLATPIDQPGALTFYEGTDREHGGFANHLTAEKQFQERGPKGQIVTVWRNKADRQNHWFDCAYNACAAGHMAGVRLLGDAAAPRRSVPARRPMSLAEYHKRRRR